MFSSATIDYIQKHRLEDVRLLALRGSKDAMVNLPTALNQIEAWQKAKEKLPLWASTEGVVFPPILSMEQCSSQLTAEYKLNQVRRLGQCGSLIDLTGGFGVDATIIGSVFKQLTYVERQDELCDVARHNFPLLRKGKTQIVCADAVQYLEEMSVSDWIFLDPARRDAVGNKVVALADCEPDVTRLEERLLQKGHYVMLKLSPMLDLSLALQQLNHPLEAHVVAVNGECKELLVLLSADAILSMTDIPIFCTNISTKGVATSPFVFTFRSEQEATCSYTSEVGSYLYEPHAALLKGGAFRSLVAAFRLQKLHPSSHLYTSFQLVTDFPGRVFQVMSVSGLGKKELRSQLFGLGRANLTTRNFPESVAALKFRLHLQDGGNDYLFATTLADGRRVLIRCQKVLVANPR